MKRLLALPLVALIVALCSPPAGAAPQGHISQVTQHGQTLSVTFSATAPELKGQFDPASIQVTVAGQPAEVKVDGASDKVARTVILALDTTDAADLAAAQSAAAAYLATLPADVSVGLVTFDDAARELVAPTTSRPAVTNALAGVEEAREAAAERAAAQARREARRAAQQAREAQRAARKKSRQAQRTKSRAPRVQVPPVPQAKPESRDTALYDGVVLATRAAGTDGVRSVVLLSAGPNTGGAATAQQAVGAIRKARTGLDAVALGSGGTGTAAALEAMVKAGDGQLFDAAGAGEAAAAFETVAASLGRQILIEATVPPGISGRSQVTVSAVVDEIGVTDSMVVNIKAPPVPILPGGAVTVAAPVGVELPGAGQITSWLGQWWVALLALVLLFAGLLTVVIVALTKDEGSEGRVTRRLSAYEMKTEGQRIATERGSDVARTAMEWATRFTEKRELDQMLAEKLEAAGLPLKPAEWFLLHIGSTISGLLVIGLLSGFGIIPLFVGAVVGFAAPYMFLSLKAERRRKAFADAVPDTLTLVAGSLSAGHSVLQAFDNIARESTGVMKQELGRAIVEARLGVPMDDALMDVADRMNSKDFRWVVMAIRVNREIGGDLAEVLRNVAAMLRERGRVMRQIRALSAEGRISAYVLVGMPIVFALIMSVIRPEYVGKLVTTPLGIAMSLSAVALICIGGFWMSRIVKVEV